MPDLTRFQPRGLWAKLTPLHEAQDAHAWTHAASETGNPLRVLLCEILQLVGDIFRRRPSR